MVVDDERITVSLWDTAGQERYSALTKFYYRGAQAAIVVFDVTQLSTFERAKEWVNEVQQNTTDSILIALIGNKIDLPQREVNAYVSFSY